MEEKLIKIEAMAKQIASKNDAEIISCEYLKEHGMNILRIIASKKPALTIDDATMLNHLISEELDKIDLIDEEYYLEVSSEGIEKELRTDTDINEAIGEYICIKGYEKISGHKEIYGDLVSYNDGIVVINANIKGQIKQLAIEKSKISKIRQAVKF